MVIDNSAPLMDAATKLDKGRKLITNVARQRPESARVLSAGILASSRDSGRECPSNSECKLVYPAVPLD